MTNREKLIETLRKGAHSYKLTGRDGLASVMAQAADEMEKMLRELQAAKADAKGESGSVT